ncbi:MAG TPA: phage holin family protein [Casimicrobiaceae bacterium]|nr:phage holin family protein [Casimicrobiaceae bacterium]
MIREATNIVGDLKGLASTGVRAVRTRLELMAIEFKEEKAWVIRLIIVAIAALYLLTFGILLGIFALALYASEENRPLILAAFAGFFLAGGIGGAAYIFMASKKRHPIFENTIAVLKGDERGLHQHLQGTGDD